MAVKRKNKKEIAGNLAVLLIRTVFFLFFPSVFSAAFAGIRNITVLMAAGGALEYNAFVRTLAGVCVLTILAGRVFCGYACAFGSLGDFVYWCSKTLRKKAGKKPVRLPEKYAKVLKYLKYVVLAGIMLLCWYGKNSAVTAFSPWTAFSLIHSRHFGAVPAGGAILLVFVTALMAAEPRAFCRFLCPMGAVFSLLPVMPWAVVHRSRSGCLKGCRACSRVCPAGIDIVDGTYGDAGLMGECFSCGKCMRACPRKNIHILKGSVSGKTYEPESRSSGKGTA